VPRRAGPFTALLGVVAGLQVERHGWSAGILIDKGHALTSISCPTTTYCLAVDRSGNAIVSTG
jgi:hypothetical protein